MTILALVLALSGFALLALSLAKHHRDLIGGMPSRTAERRLRTGGWLLLSVSLTSCIAADGLSIGLVLWSGTLTIAALAVVAMITYQELWRRG
ncbi:DUF3325 domain-containing protein [Sphingomonas colocasiae]|uniref:DUF3325 domain-containing protein n=1 Tax=Sphingomonas colocasiae TaxID=1848973 RepID=A0ABS7PNA5_9SPHN|nr:DUF3325 domain-containing protein [Sphingomonas colocasiae]MBY8822800.1 DUF3325 domain-containing protein [Sphingomonas colocasiae]